MTVGTILTIGGVCAAIVETVPLRVACSSRR
jgi:hypothetical protein